MVGMRGREVEGGRKGKRSCADEDGSPQSRGMGPFHGEQASKGNRTGFEPEPLKPTKGNRRKESPSVQPPFPLKGNSHPQPTFPIG